MRPSLRNIIIAVAALVLLVGGIVAWNAYQAAHRGTVTLNLSPNSTDGVTVSFNGTDKPVHRLYTLPNGTYQLRVNRPGFKPFSTSFDLKGRQALIVDVRLELTTTPTISSTSQLSMPGIPVSQVHIDSVRYFENNLWAVVRVAMAGTDSATVVVEYDPVKAAWQTRGGPGTSFNESFIAKLPTSVGAYLRQNSLLQNGGST